MNKEIQPDFKETTITCGCGNVFETKSIKDEMKTDVCSKCHPFWAKTKTQVAKGGRADKFKEKYGI